MSTLREGMIVVEPGFRGHRLDYVHRAVAMHRECGTGPSLLATSIQASGSDEFRSQWTEMDAPRLLCYINERATLRNRLSDLLIIRRAVVQQRMIPKLFFPNVDEYLLPLFLLMPFMGRMHVSGIIMRPPSGHSLRVQVKRCIVWILRLVGYDLAQLSNSLLRVQPVGAVLDPSGLKPCPPDMDGRLLREDVEDWLQSLDQPTIGLIGVLDDRKNLEKIVQWAVDTGQFRVILAGKPESDEIADRLNMIASRDPVRVFRVFRRLTEYEIDVLVSASTCIGLLYDNASGSSGMVTVAARLGIPILAWGNETVVQLALDGYGAEVAALDPESLMIAMSQVGAPWDAPPLESRLEACDASWRRLIA